MMARFTLKKRFTFEAAHYLPHHQGKCQRMHGHSWVGWVEVESDELQATGPGTGMVIDFSSVADAVKPLVDQFLDHYLLNESLGMESPTSEAVAVWVFGRLAEHGLPVSAVTIEETCTNVCIYRG
jgi:6-pyruvoyltetrahydropterin/6-carboxytetrahydropterin synthase